MALVYRLQADKNAFAKVAATGGKIVDMIIEFDDRAEAERFTADPEAFCKSIGAFIEGMDFTKIGNSVPDFQGTVRAEHEAGCQMGWSGGGFNR